MCRVHEGCCFVLGAGNRSHPLCTTASSSSLRLDSGNESHIRAVPLENALLMLASHKRTESVEEPPSSSGFTHTKAHRNTPSAYPSILEQPTVPIQDSLQDPQEVRALRAVQMREELHQRGLPAHGKKAVMAQRLTDYVHSRNAEFASAEQQEAKDAKQAADGVMAELVQCRLEQSVSGETRQEIKAALVRRQLERTVDSQVVVGIRSGLQRIHAAQSSCGPGHIQLALVADNFGAPEEMGTGLLGTAVGGDGDAAVDVTDSSPSQCREYDDSSQWLQRDEYRRSTCSQLVEAVVGRNKQFAVHDAQVNYGVQADDEALQGFEVWLLQAQRKGKVSAHAASSALSGLRLAQLESPESPQSHPSSSQQLSASEEDETDGSHEDTHLHDITMQDIATPPDKTHTPLSPKQLRSRDVLSPNWRTVHDIAEAVTCVQQHLDRFEQRQAAVESMMVSQEEWVLLGTALEQAKAEESWDGMKAALGLVSADAWRRIQAMLPNGIRDVLIGLLCDPLSS
jgi:hypothetical protein